MQVADFEKDHATPVDSALLSAQRDKNPKKVEEGKGGEDGGDEDSTPNSILIYILIY
jgi:hypothetical protein